MKWPWRADTPFEESQFSPSRGHEPAGWRALWPIAGLIVVSGCALAAGLFYLHVQAISAGEQLGAALAHVIEEQTSRTFQTVDQQLQLAAVRLQAREAERRLDEDSARAVLHDHLKQLPFARAIWVLDREGRIVFDSDKGNIGVKLADREYFRIYAQQATTEFYLSAPVRSRSTGTWLIGASRPMRAAGGEVVGVIVCAVDPPYFARLWSTVHAGPGGAVTLFRRDGTLMLRSPQIDSAMGKRFPALPLVAEHLPKNPQGSYETTRAIDPIVRFISYRALSLHPDLVVAVGRPYESVLGNWARFAWLSALFWLAAVAAATWLTMQRRRHLAQYQRSEARFGELAQSMPQIVFMADAHGTMTFVSEQWTQATGQPVEMRSQAVGSSRSIPTTGPGRSRICARHGPPARAR